MSYIINFRYIGIFPFYQHNFQLAAQFEVWFMFVVDMRQGKLRTLNLMLWIKGLFKSLILYEQ